MTGTRLAWFRRDLRIHDNPMLAEAAKGGAVAALFVFDARLLRGARASANRNAFLLASLSKLAATLAERGVPLHVTTGDPAAIVPHVAAEAGAESVHVSRDYSPFARARDAAVSEALAGNGITLTSHPGTLISEPGDVTKRDGGPYSVFTPFYRRWQATNRRKPVDLLAQLDGLAIPGYETALPDPGQPGFQPTAEALPTAGETAARGRLERWLDGGIAHYEDERNFLAAGGTSRLSADLHFGLLSPLEVAARSEATTAASAGFLAQLAWRDFYHHVLWHFSHVVSEPFNRKYAALEWRDAPGDLDAWKAGETGYPIVDAAMRELLATGYMHNRARMITASFLTKHLLIDWREGEAHFLRHLVDGDIANNNGGWQWAASTGTDAAPYFRVFNPVRQGQRFDADGDYVRTWLPALANVPARAMHSPWEMTPDEQQAARCIIGRDYPAPMVDHAEARQRALAHYGDTRPGR